MLFEQRLLVHVDIVKEFYAKMKVTHLRKKDVIKSSVKGIDIEFDHERLATILGVHSENGMREYIEEVWEESKYTKPLEITRRVANDETIGSCQKNTFLTMCKLTREDGVWWIGSGENRRRDDAPEEEEEEEEERNKDDFGREVVIDEATIEGNRARMIDFMMLEVGEEEPVMKLQRHRRSSFIFDFSRKIENSRSRPLGSH
ncbi:hypothetical protein Dimus_030238 [Dionaea muscipula]